MDRKWKSLLYRFIDGGDLAQDIRDRLLKIEETLFKSIIAEVVDETGREWEGDIKQQRLADNKVATSLKQSFVDYEKSKAKTSKSFFKF